jgi:hypothetical protein
MNKMSFTRSDLDQLLSVFNRNPDLQSVKVSEVEGIKIIADPSLPPGIGLCCADGSGTPETDPVVARWWHGKWHERLKSGAYRASPEQ